MISAEVAALDEQAIFRVKYLLAHEPEPLSLQSTGIYATVINSI